MNVLMIERGTDKYKYKYKNNNKHRHRHQKRIFFFLKRRKNKQKKPTLPRVVPLRQAVPKGAYGQGEAEFCQK